MKLPSAAAMVCVLLQTISCAFSTRIEQGDLFVPSEPGSELSFARYAPIGHPLLVALPIALCVWRFAPPSSKLQPASTLLGLLL
jgi:hypothetical protein